MKKFSIFSNKDQFESSLLQVVENTINSYGGINQVLHENLYCLDAKGYHFIIELLKTNLTTKDSALFEETKKAFFLQLLSNLYQAEHVSGDSAYVSFLFSLLFVKNLLQNPDSYNRKNNVQLHKELEEAWKGFKSKIEENSNVASERMLKQQIMNTCCHDGDNDPLSVLLAETIWQAINLAGLEGKIFLEEGRNKNFIVEHKEGYTFDLELIDHLLIHNKRNTWERRQVKVFVLDGILEKVSEIDQLLTKALETKQSLLIISQGFSEEVIATCKINNEKELFDVFLAKTKNDINSLNQLNDVGIVCDYIPLSVHTGQLISMVKWDELPVVEKVFCSKKETTIENGSTKAAVENHIAYLIHKKQNTEVVEDIRNIIDKRIRSLISNSVIIHIPESSQTEINTIKIKFDSCLRQCKTILNYGFVNLYDVINKEIEKPELGSNEKNAIAGVFYNTLKDLSDYQGKRENERVMFPVLSVIAGFMIVSKSVMNIIGSSGYVYLDI